MRMLSRAPLSSFQVKIVFIILGMVWVLAGASRPVQADGLTTSTRICPSDVVADCIVTTGTTTASNIGQSFGSAGGPTMTSTAIVDASYGTLGAYATTTISDYAPGTYQASPSGSIPFAVSGSAHFADTLTVTSAVSTGYVLFDVSVTGSVSDGSTCSPQLCPIIGVGAYLNNASFSPVQGDLNEVLALPFTSGVADPFSIGFTALIDLPDYNELPGYSYTGTVDYADTLTVTGIQIVNSSMAPIAGATYTDDSGTNYAAIPSDAPEPATWLLLGFSLCALELARRTRRPSHLCCNSVG